MTKKLPIVDFFHFLEKGLNDSNEFFYSHSPPYHGAKNDQKNYSQNDQKNTNCWLFPFSRKVSERFERTFLQPFSTLSWSYLCNGIKIVCLRSKTHSQRQPQKDEKSHYWTLFQFSEKLVTIRTKISAVILHHNRTIFVQRDQNWKSGICVTKPKFYHNGPKTGHFWTFFSNFLIYFPYDLREISYSLSKPYYSPWCAMALYFYSSELRKIARSSPKVTKKKTVKTSRTIFSTVILNRTM